MSWMRAPLTTLAKGASMVLAGTLALTLSLGAQANLLERYVEGKDYFLLNKPVKTEDPNKIEVAELFSYLCPHCNSLEPTINAWKKNIPEDVSFIRKHAQFSRQYMAYAKLHVAIQLLGIEEKVHEGIFNSVHKSRDMKYEPEDQYDLVKEAGVKKEDFLKVYDSFAHKSKLKQIEKDMVAYQIQGVPAVIVNGKYRVTVSSAGTPETMLEVVDFLVDKERSAKKAAAKK